MEQNQSILPQELERSNDIIRKMDQYYKSKMVGQEKLKMALLTAFIANGHLLIESIPGLAKTTAAKVLTEAVAGKFSRIQCTPDLLPSDIIGTQIFNYSTNAFETRLGPVYANFVLLDEINRSSAKTQSAMLEAMQEYQASIGGVTYKMPDVFVVIATQNPIEQEGTYVLAEAQLDRFLLKEVLTYPTIGEEIEVLNRIEKNAFKQTQAVLNIDDVVYLQQLGRKVYLDDAVKKYIANIIFVTRNAEKYIPVELSKYIEMGSSPRGSIAFMEASKANALISGRSYVSPDDVKAVCYGVLRHRLMLNFSAIADRIKPEIIIDALINSVVAP